jgi:hypothetical protein
MFVRTKFTKVCELFDLKILKREEKLLLYETFVAKVVSDIPVYTK